MTWSGLTQLIPDETHDASHRSQKCLRVYDLGRHPVDVNQELGTAMVT